MSVTFEDNKAPPIHLEQQDRWPYPSVGSIADDAVLSSNGVRILSSYGGLRSAPFRADWLSDAARDLVDWVAQPAGWDSYGALRISPNAAQHAFGLLRSLAKADVPRPFITGTTDGGINMQWDTAAYDIQITVTDQSASGFVWDKASDEQWEGPLSRAKVLVDAMVRMVLG